jgi:hypothetical protein
MNVYFDSGVSTRVEDLEQGCIRTQDGTKKICLSGRRRKARRSMALNDDKRYLGLASWIGKGNGNEPDEPKSL